MCIFFLPKRNIEVTLSQGSKTFRHQTLVTDVKE